MEIYVRSVEEIKRLGISALHKVGVDQSDAEIVVDTLVEADLRGVTSHGIKNLPVYIERIQKKGINVMANIEVEPSCDNIFLVNGHGGLGQVAAYETIALIRNAANQGKIAAASVRNTNHCGMLAYYTQKISDKDCIGIMCCNTNPNVAAFGGAEAVLGTNPFSVAIPYGKRHIVLDMATSSIAKGKVYEYFLRKEALPGGVALDGDGNMTVEPKQALHGVMLSFAGHKGYSIALLIEILSGVLSGSGFSSHVRSFHHDLDKIQNVGFFMMALPIKSFVELEEFYNRMNELVSIVKGSKKQNGVFEIFMPGEIEEKTYQEKYKAGIGLDKYTLDSLVN